MEMADSFLASNPILPQQQIITALFYPAIFHVAQRL
jgi:hypothetical protein